MNPTERLQCLHCIELGIAKAIIRANSLEVTEAISEMMPYMDKLHEDLTDDTIKWIQRNREGA